MSDIDTLARQLAGNLTLNQLRERQQAFTAGGSATERPAQFVEAEVGYWQRVFAEQPARQELAVTTRLEQEMDYDQARKKFWSIMQMRAAHIMQLENDMDFAWEFTPEEVERNRNLLKYFINDATGAYLLHKGLFVFGQNGTGKTEIMAAFSRFCEQEKLSKQFVFCSMSKVYADTRADKDYNPLELNQQHNRCFDEFGRHIGPVLRFGDHLDVNEAIIEARYERFRRYGQFTHFITNMAPNEGEGNFSPMVFDRLRSMCTSVAFTGKSRRV